MYKLLGLIAVALLCGCTSSALYNPAYVIGTSTPGEPLAGKALVLTDPDDDQLHVLQAPSSFTGGASKLDIEIGNMIRQIAKVKFARVFVDGAELANEMVTGADYAVVVTPKLGSLDYQYSQLQNFGMAVTPKVRVIVAVKVVDADGMPMLEKQYDSSEVQGDTYIFNGNPAEAINKALHDALSQVMASAAADVYAALAK